MKSSFLFVLSFISAASAAEPSPKDAAFFETRVRPLMQKRCVECHGEKKQKAELRLDAKAHAFKGSENGAVITAGDSAKSSLYQRVVSTKEDERMPPKGDALTQEEAQSIKAWIDAGAVWPESDADKSATVDKRLQHWSLQPVKKDFASSANVDSFIIAKLADAGLTLSPQADRRTLIRRAYYDVTGLPPAPEEVNRFVADTDPKAYEKLVDRLLVSPRYGERWARHWLDVVRFAESDGFEMNNARHNAWPYRDYVINAFNSDKPYDQFVRDQLAGDALGADAATGFLVGGAMDKVKSKDPVLTANQRADELHDMVSTTSATFIGLTVNCARCHDHKFDAISAEDYYSMIAMLQGVRHGERPLRSAETQDNLKKLAALRTDIAPLDAKLAAYQPRANLARVLLIDDSAAPSSADKPGVTQIEQPANGKPIVYSPGEERGQADDQGDSARLPNLGESYRYWSATADKSEDFCTFDPRLGGRYRIWVSWGAWTTHAKDARYVLDADGDLNTKDDQTEIAQADQSTFADGSPAIPKEKRWSGFKLAGVHTLTPKSVVILRSGIKGGPTVADVMAFEQADESAAKPTVPRLRAPVSHRANEDRFDVVEAKFVRFAITSTKGSEACLDELEIFTAGPGSRNAALESNGGVVTTSPTYANGMNINHRPKHLNDGLYGNAHSWIPEDKKGGWAQIELAKPERIDRVVWSRDRSTGKGKVFEDRLATGYRIEISVDGKQWQTVATSDDRLGSEFRTRIASMPTLSDVPKSEAEAVGKLTKQRGKLLDEIQKLSVLPVAYAGNFEQPGQTFRNHRGDPMQPREPVAPGALARIGPKLKLPADTPEQERRLALANWITDPNHPLTARVMVNRLWHYHFGTGIMDTPSDFGINGSRPTHPELLDWLANRLVANQWKLKPIHRLILLSKTYMQSSAANEAGLKKDSNARLLWRYPPHRLEAEALRDSILAVTGKLDLTMGGPGFDLFEFNENYVKVYITKAEYGPAEFRRMVYQSKPRTMLDDFFGAFDCPDAGQPAPKRTSSTTPLQALNLLNSNFALQQAGFFAERLQADVGMSADAQVKRAFELIFCRAPSPDESADSVKLIAGYGLPVFCRALFNSNEFIRLN